MRGKHIVKKMIAAGLCALLLCGFLTPAFSEEYRELKYGSKGDDVQRFKKAMFWLGYFSTEDLDGTYTATTADRDRHRRRGPAGIGILRQRHRHGHRAVPLSSPAANARAFCHPSSIALPR